MREKRTSLRYNVVLPLKEAKKMLGKSFLRIKDFLWVMCRNKFWVFFYFYSKERKAGYKEVIALEKKNLRKDLWKNVLYPFDKFMYQRDWYAYLTDPAFRASISEKFRREQTNLFGVVLTWILEESWWAVVAKVVFWYHNDLFPWYDSWRWTLRDQRRVSFSKRKQMERHLMRMEARDYLQAKYGDRVYQSHDFSLLFFRYFWIFSNEGPYASDWVTAKETKRLSWLYFHKLYLLATVRKVPFLQSQLLAFVFNEKESLWAKHWASSYITQERYIFLQDQLKRLYKFLLKYFGPFVYFFSVIVQNYIDGFILMRIAIEEIWEDYYVFLYRDEWNYARIGIIVFFQEGFSFIFRTDDLFEIFTFRYWYNLPYFKATRTFLWLFADDMYTGFCYSVLVVDVITRPLVGIIWKRSFLENMHIWVSNPIIRLKEDIKARLYFISKLGFREGVKAYYFSKYLKGFFQLSRVSNRAIFPWEGRIIRKARELEDLQNVAFDYRAYKKKKKIIDYIYEGFNQTFNTFIEIVCDPEELKDYRTRKYDAARKERTTLSNPWQYWNRWRVFKAWRVLNEDLDNYGMDSGSAEIKEARNKRQYFDVFVIFLKTAYSTLYSWYVHRTKLEFWLRPLVEGVRWCAYVLFVPFFYLWFFLRNFVIPILLFLKEFWFNIGLKITLPLYVFCRKRADMAIKRGSSIWLCKFWAFWAPDLLDCIRGLVKSWVMFCVTGVLFQFIYDDLLYLVQNWTEFFDSWVMFMSAFVLGATCFYSFFCRDFREVFYEEFEDLAIWWFHLIYTGMLVYFVLTPGDFSLGSLQHKKLGHALLNSQQLLQCSLPHYRKTYLPPFF